MTSERSILENGTVIDLYVESNGERHPRQFNITKLISNRGASTIAYRAFHENSSNIGILREFFPVEHDIVLERNSEGIIDVDINPKSEAERLLFMESKKRYLEPFSVLKKLQREHENDSLASFIPNFEVYYGSKNIKEDDGTVYIWTPAPQTETFLAICEEIHNNPEVESEYKLYTVLNAMYSLTQCVGELHNNGLIHRDIKPDNFGFVTRNNEVLTQSISLFDIDSICKAYPTPEEDMGTLGFMESVSERKNDNLRDIYSIGATLFYALIITDRTKKEGYKYQDSYYSDISDLVKCSSLISASDSNSYPRLRNYLSRILRKCLCSRYSLEEKRYEDCEELAADIRVAISYVMPLEHSRRYSTGEKWVFQDTRRWFSAKEKKNSQLALQYHLYKYPLYEKMSAEEDLTILIIGFGKYGYKFLDLALQAAQNIGKSIKATVISDTYDSEDNTDEELYLEERPEFTRFFNVSGHLQDELAYGSVLFQREPLVDKSDKLEICDNVIRKIVSKNKKTKYVFVDLNDDRMNKNAASVIKETRCTGLINYVQEGILPDSALDEDGIFPVRVSEDARQSEEFDEIERMAFNAHLVWNENSDISFEEKKREFLQEYNYDSCVSNVLSIKYKLWREGIDLEKEGVYDAASKMDYILKTNLDERQYLTWLEHRRWVTEKICDGWVSRTIDECMEIADVVEDVTRDKDKKTHVCILKSTPKWELDGKNTSEWDVNGMDVSKLDDLDRLSVELHRFYESQAENMIYGDFEFERMQLMNTGAFNCFEEWIEAKDNLIKNANRESAAVFKALWIRLAESISNDESGDITSSQKQSVIGSIDKKIKPLLNKYDYKNYKKIDVDLIDRIPYILTYSENIEIVFPMKTFNHIDELKGFGISTENVFMHVASATVLNPVKINFLYYAPEKSGLAVLEAPSILRNVLERIVDYKERKELRFETRLIVFYHTDTTRSFYDMSGLDNKDLTIEYIKIQKNENIRDVAEEFISNLANREYVIFEETSDFSGGWLNDSRIKSMMPSFCFNGAEQVFKRLNGCDWVGYINCNASLNVRDLAKLSGDEFNFDEKLDFGTKGNNELWKIYKNDRLKWKRCSVFLSKQDNHLRDILTCTQADVDDGQIGTFRFYLSAECMPSLQLLIKNLIISGLIFDDSHIFMCSNTICCMTVKCSSKMRDILDKALDKEYVFKNVGELKISPIGKEGEDDLELSVKYNGLTLDGVDLDARVEELVANKYLKSNARTKNETKRYVKDILNMFRGKGFIMNLRTKNNKISFTYGSQTIKKLMINSGKILELRVYQELLNMQTEEAGRQMCFDDIVGGITFYNEFGVEQIDCLVTKGFKSIIIECKAQDGLSKETINQYVSKLNDRVLKYGLFSRGLLLIDSSEPLATTYGNENVIIKRVDDIEGSSGNKIAKFIYELLSK